MRRSGFFRNKTIPQLVDPAYKASYADREKRLEERAKLNARNALALRRPDPAPQPHSAVAAAARLVAVSAAFTPQPKEPAEKNRRTLRLACGRPCLLRWQPGCLGLDGSTTVACHENRLSARKGMGYKGHDWRSVWGCAVCHREFDQGRSDAAVLDAVFDAAWPLQLVEWVRIAENPAERAWARAAAAWALERAAAHGVGVK